MTEMNALMTCGVCGSRLNWYQTPDGQTGWTHPSHVTEDHLVVPVQQDQLPAEEVCDFCLDKHVVTQFHAPPSTITTPGADDVVHIQQEDGVWVACSRCAVLVRNRDLEALVSRVAREHHTKHGQVADTDLLRRIYRRLMRRNVEKPLGSTV